MLNDLCIKPRNALPHRSILCYLPPIVENRKKDCQEPDERYQEAWCRQAKDRMPRGQGFSLLPIPGRSEGLEKEQTRSIQNMAGKATSISQRMRHMAAKVGDPDDPFIKLTLAASLSIHAKTRRCKSFSLNDQRTAMKAHLEGRGGL